MASAIRSAASAAAAASSTTASLAVRRVLLEHGALNARQIAKLLPLEHFKSLTHLKNNVLGELERRHGVRKLCLKSETGKRVWAWELRKQYADPDVPGQLAGPGTAFPPKKPLHADVIASEKAKCSRPTLRRRSK